MYRCLITGNQSFIRVDQRIHNRRDRFHVFHQSADEIIRLFAQSIVVTAVRKNISAVVVQGHIDVHAGAVDAVYRFRHKGSMTVLLGNRFYRQLEGHNIIGCRQSLIVLDINFMLGRCHFVVGCLHDKAHIFQGHNHIPTGIFPEIHRT